MTARLDAFWQRLLGGAATAALARPRATLALAAAIALASGLAVATRLELRTSNLDLVDPDLPEIARFRAFAADFGTPNLLVVALEGDPERLPAAALRVAAAARRASGARAAIARLPFDEDLLSPFGIDPAFRSRDGRTRYVLVQPDDPESAAVTIAPFVEGVRREIAALGLEREGVHVGTTGLPQYALDDRDVVRADISRLSGVSFVLIAVLFVAGLRGWREPLAAMAVLALAALATAGVAAFVPGHLTLVSAFFFSILFGLGIDFGVHVVDLAEERRASGAEPRAALEQAIRFLAPGLGTGAATTAASFLLLTASGLRGFAELGWLAGVGVALALAGLVTVLPVLLVRHGGRRRPRPAAERATGRWLLALQRPALAVPLIALALAAPWAGWPPFDGDYLALQPAGSETVRLERAMVEGSDFAPQFAAFVAPDEGAAAALAERLRAEPLVGEVRTAADFAALVALDAAIPGEWEAFRALYVAADGRQAVYAFPTGDAWEPGFQGRFVEAMRAIDPEATGMPFVGRFLVERSRRALRITGWLAALLLLALVASDFGDPVRVALALTPTVLGVATMLVAMRLAGVPFNPLDVLALPIVLGVAEDSGVHLVHRFHAEGGDLARTLAGAGRSVLLCGATTLVGFGALVFARHRGLASFAFALAAGVAAALASSLVVLPQLLRARETRRRRRARVAAPVVALAGALALGAAPASAAPDAGDDCWRGRARRTADGWAVDAGRARCAAESAEAAWRADARPELAFRAVERIWFAAHFAAPDAGARRALLDRAVAIADRTVAAVDPAGGPTAGEANFWAAVAWGEWGIERGWLASAFAGVPGRLRRHAEAAARWTPALRDGGGLRLLGRLHSVLPRLPGVTGWIDRERGVELLRRALALSDRDPRNAYFLAEALLDRGAADRGEALRLLADLARRSPDPAEALEQGETLALAREKLAALRARAGAAR
jgi:predicted RND superfamily exporter protein